MEVKVNYHTDFLFGLTKKYVLSKCLGYSLPGNEKWPSNHPIWDCNVAGYKTPRDAWNDPETLMKAITNLFWITNKSVIRGEYPDFVKRIHGAFIDHENLLRKEVMNRFTIAKIAPKVTALQPSYFTRILNEAKVDLGTGVYYTMAGFGGIKKKKKKWFTEHNINADIEAYDINLNFCNWYGWTQRDVLAQKITTDKIVIVCPPFGPKTERWKGTPDNMYYDFHDWCKLIREYVIAPNYIFIGPELGKSKKKNNNCGLFGKTMGIQWYPEYTNNE